MASLLCKIYIFDFFNMVDFFQIFVISPTTEILMVKALIIICDFFRKIRWFSSSCMLIKIIDNCFLNKQLKSCNFLIIFFNFVKFNVFYVALKKFIIVIENIARLFLLSTSNTVEKPNFFLNFYF